MNRAERREELYKKNKERPSSRIPGRKRYKSIQKAIDALDRETRKLIDRCT